MSEVVSTVQMSYASNGIADAVSIGRGGKKACAEFRAVDKVWLPVVAEPFGRFAYGRTEESTEAEQAGR
jgi:hypothetical protein